MAGAFCSRRRLARFCVSRGARRSGPLNTTLTNQINLIFHGLSIPGHVNWFISLVLAPNVQCRCVCNASTNTQIKNLPVCRTSKIKHIQEQHVAPHFTLKSTSCLNHCLGRRHSRSDLIAGRARTTMPRLAEDQRRFREVAEYLEEREERRRVK